MCWYCGCHTIVVRHDAPILSYADALLRELDIVAGCLPARAAVGHLHWGGGSPTILEPHVFERRSVMPMSPGSSEERRVGTERVSPWSMRWGTVYYNKKK